MRVRVRVPASSANLGPGFDCLGLALDLWNETTLRVEGRGLNFEIEGEGAETIIRSEDNLIIQAMRHLYQKAGQPFPRGLHLTCINRVPLGSGLGSSSSAILTGLLSANAFCDSSFSPSALLAMAAELEGHADNLAAALWGGLVLVAKQDGGWLAQTIELPVLDWHIVVVVPRFQLPTRHARSVLPEVVPLPDAVFNNSRTALLVEALRTGNFTLLHSAIHDRLHQPYRLGLIPGADEALRSAQDMGAAAALSGAGPSLIAFCQQDASLTAQQMQKAFQAAGLDSRSMFLSVSRKGAEVSTLD